jgi:glutamate-ammonia-ligase adenylyltransferase
MARRDLIARHGEPYCEEAGQRRVVGFAIIAYGKLGGFELGYGSDLDLVFLHDGRSTGRTASPERGIENDVFFTRLAQRIIHLLSTVTPAGRAYDTDTRLRPSGASGLLVSSLEAFHDYQHHHAWTWEHQALVRARPVAGDRETIAGFAAIRQEVLSKARDRDTLRADTRSMRQRMRAELLRNEAGAFDLKQGLGGITDIEFMVQYNVLRWAATHPELLAETANRKLLQLLAAKGLMNKEDCKRLLSAYLQYRARGHAQALQEQAATIPNDELQEHRQRVAAIWKRVIENQETKHDDG